MKEENKKCKYCGEVNEHLGSCTYNGDNGYGHFTIPASLIMPKEIYKNGYPTLKEFKKFLAEKCYDLKHYRDGDYDKDIYEFLTKLKL